MLIIRDEQVAAFESAALRDFEDEMLEHLRGFSPPLVRALGDEQVRLGIRLGLARAEGHGLTLRGPARLYLELMVGLGSDFDTDPQYPWAADVLRDPETAADPMERAERLFQKAIDYRKLVVGPRSVYALAALKAVRDWLRAGGVVPEGEFPPGMLHLTAELWPRKATYVDRAGLETLVRSGAELARSHGLSTHREMGLIVALMLGFGHGCLSDPFYPWVGRTLRLERPDTPSERAKRLEARALSWVEEVITYLEKAAVS